MSDSERWVTILNKSCLRMDEVEDGAAQTIITSPPYGPACHNKKYGNHGEDIANESPTGFVMQLEEILGECYRVLNDRGTIWVVVGDYSHQGKYVSFSWQVHELMTKVGFLPVQPIYWFRPDAMPQNARRRFNKKMEIVWLMCKDKKEYFLDKDPVRVPHKYAATDRRAWKYNPLGKDPGDMWEFPQPKRYRSVHPAMFPAALVERCLLASTRPEDLVVDPMGGSMTVACVAHLHQRRCVTYEVYPKYLRLGRKRLLNTIRGGQVDE